MTKAYQIGSTDKQHPIMEGCKIGMRVLSFVELCVFLIKDITTNNKLPQVNHSKIWYVLYIADELGDCSCTDRKLQHQLSSWPRGWTKKPTKNIFSLIILISWSFFLKIMYGKRFIVQSIHMLDWNAATILIYTSLQAIFRITSIPGMCKHQYEQGLPLQSSKSLQKRWILFDIRFFADQATGQYSPMLCEAVFSFHRVVGVNFTCS